MVTPLAEIVVMILIAERNKLLMGMGRRLGGKLDLDVFS
jgi:hypothetical protein